VAKHRPSLPLVAVSPDAGVVRQLSLVWGVVPLLGPAAAGFESMVTDAEVLLRRHGLAASGDVVVVTAGMHAGRPGTTNLIKAHRLA
jgi:pyruvate kinase